MFKNLSYVFTAIAAVSFLLAFIANYLLGGRIIFRHYTFVSGTQIFLFAAILFALYHLIKLKEK